MRIPDTIFVTGIGTGIGKTLVSAVLTEALEADYWKPVQAGSLDNTDSDIVGALVSTITSRTHAELYRLQMAASPHIAARDEELEISIADIVQSRPHAKRLIIEGAGGLMVPLNEREFVADLIKALQVPVVLVSRNVLGSINHSLLTAIACKQKGIKVLGWVFNDNYLDYEAEIVQWTGIPRLFSMPFSENPDKQFVKQQAERMREELQNW